VAEARGYFGNREEGERPPFEAVTRGLAKTADQEGLTLYCSELWAGYPRTAIGRIE
jgi:hypothetical protein